MTRIILASQSQARQQMLTDAGLVFQTMSADVDEAALKHKLSAAYYSAAEIAAALARAKAVDVAQTAPDAMIIGGDQTLSLADGTMLDKPVTPDRLAAQLRRLSGTGHQLHSAATIVERGKIVWEDIETVTMTMAPLSDSFIVNYVNLATPDLLGCVGGYQIERGGVRLFSAIEGSYFAILGLPLLPLLTYLRGRGIMGS